MKIQNVESAQRLYRAAQTVSQRLLAPNYETVLACGEMQKEDGCMCAIGHMIHEFNPSIDLRLNKNWVDIVVDNIGVNSSEGKVVVDNLLEPVWKANDRSFGLPSVSGRALSAFAMAFRAHVEQSNEGVTLE